MMRRHGLEEKYLPGRGGHGEGKQHEMHVPALRRRSGASGRDDKQETALGVTNLKGLRARRLRRRGGGSRFELRNNSYR